MVDKIKAWYASHSADAHYLFAGIAFLIAAYFQVPKFHDNVNAIYGLLPQTAKETIATLIAMVMWYRSTRKAAK